ncbi:response regulator [Rhodopirellula sp.]|nr:AAA family ATPase [Rhodopirellula sp.]MDB4679171.1 response regulator [Rhodopirellula sp.]
MSNSLRIALVDPNDQTRNDLKQILSGIGDAWLESDCSRYEFFVGLVNQSRPDIAIVGIDSDAEKAIYLIQQINRESPETSILVASAKTDGQLILRTIRAGALEYLPVPVDPEELSTAIKRVRRQRPAIEGEESKECEVIAIAGANGGVGTTSVAVNLGCALAQEPDHSVALLDLDLALGDADVFLDLVPEYTLADVVQNVNRLDIQLLRKSMTKHETGLFLLPRPVDLLEAEMIAEDSLIKVIDLMKLSFTHLIIDLSKSYNALDKAAMEAASRILLLSQLDLPCLRNAVRVLMNFEDSDDLKSKVEIVVNRTGFEAGQISLRKARETLNHEIFAQIPNDFRTMVDVRNNGVPLVTQSPKSAIAQSFRRLAKSLEPSSDGLVVAPIDDDQHVKGWKKFWPGIQH